MPSLLHDVEAFTGILNVMMNYSAVNRLYVDGTI